MISKSLIFGVLAMLMSCTAQANLKERGCPTGTANYTYGMPQLPLGTNGYIPAIDNETMFIHSTRHAGGAIANLNTILARYPTLQNIPLAELVRSIGSPTFDKQNGILANDSLAIRNNAGSAYNHAIFWRIMTTFNTSTPAVLNPALAAIITNTFGSPANMTARLQTAANGIFGSGWAWLVLQSNNTLAIVTTPNQDSPIMRQHVRAANRGFPIIGIDVWEHAYYIRYRNFRSNYVANWMRLIDWSVLQRNYELVKLGLVDSIYC